MDKDTHKGRNKHVYRNNDINIYIYKNIYRNMDINRKETLSET